MNYLGYEFNYVFLKLGVCILLRVLGQVEGFRLTQHWLLNKIFKPVLR
jgi:hypothetical protein